MDLFSGLLLYEIVLLILGVVLFLVLTGLLVYLVLKNGNYKPLIVLFLVPVVMIGFSSFQKISYNNGVLELEKMTKDLAASPESITPEEKEEIAATITQVESRAENDPEAQVKLAEANLKIGDTVKAQIAIDRARELKPNIIVPKKFDRRLMRVRNPE